MMNDIPPAGVPMINNNDLIRDDKDQDTKDNFDFNLYIGDDTDV